MYVNFALRYSSVMPNVTYKIKQEIGPMVQLTI